MENLIVMSSKYRCDVCKKIFHTPRFYYEKHGLDNPPYERVAVCPNCNSENFCSFDTSIEKTEVAEKLLFAVAAFNRYSEKIKDIFGADAKNPDFCEGIDTINELLYEMFSFISVEAERKISGLQTVGEVERFLFYLKG